MRLFWTCRCGHKTYNHYDTCDQCSMPKPPPPAGDSKLHSQITGQRRATNPPPPKPKPEEDIYDGSFG